MIPAGYEVFLYEETFSPTELLNFQPPATTSNKTIMGEGNFGRGRKRRGWEGGWGVSGGEKVNTDVQIRV